MSCLDLWIVSRELLPYVSSLVIDKDKNITPHRAVKEKGKHRLVYTDHLSSILQLKDLPRRKKKKEIKRTIWNLAKPNSWTEYGKVSDDYSEELGKIVEDKNTTIQEAMNKFEKLHEKIKFKVFGKVSVGHETKEKHTKSVNGNEEERAKAIYEEQIKTVEVELNKIKEIKNGKAGQIWKIREQVIGQKKKKLVPNAIINPKTKKLVVNQDEIKEVTLKYCVDTLSSNKPEVQYENTINEKKQDQRS